MCMKLLKNAVIICLIASFAFGGCKKKDDDPEPEPTTGFIKGTVTDYETAAGVENVRIVVFNADTDSPISDVILTSADGTFSVELLPGDYYLQLSAQGYEKIPAIGVAPISANVTLGGETVMNYQLNKASVSNGGFISGTTSADVTYSGALVVATDGTNAYSAITASDGSYYIYNVPAGSYTVQAYIAGFNSATINADVAEGTETVADAVVLSSGASGSVAGAVTFLATENGEVDVTLTHPLTKETIPGLVTKTVDANYAISNIPNGTYIARASFENDSYVVDPDWIVKNGEPVVESMGSNIDLPFSVTGAVIVNSPSTSTALAIPVEITETVPTFTWTAYSSTSDYVLEVSDVNGNIIWGGFTVDGETITKNVTVERSVLSAEFNFDGSASIELEKGQIYRWRVYASKDDTKDPNGWKLISVSEDQKGLFIIK